MRFTLALVCFIFAVSLFLLIPSKNSVTNTKISTSIPMATPTESGPTPTTRAYSALSPTPIPQTNFKNIISLFNAISAKTNINFTSPKITTSHWAIQKDKLVDYHENIPAMKVANNYIKNTDINKIDSFFINNGFINDGLNESDMTVVGSQGYINNDIFCNFELASIPSKDYPNGENPFTDYSRISLSCGYTKEIATAPTPTPQN